ncbi:7812_t:CDS:2 [Diversispora eburnea]|uniref:7812_t:CDS:1 n=1 Tax=Diversispora eburnea TaxID=1213867 RepID=A0A9N9CN05_9GLOM|nr:7812_t:CDS:2 [Diversispora eburnea]
MLFLLNHLKDYSTVFLCGAGGIDGNLDALVIPLSPNPEGFQEPIHDIKYYFCKRPKDYKCEFFHLQINKKQKVGIELGDRDIVNHSGRSTPITKLFWQGVPLVTTMSITGHKSESSYRIYARPSTQQKEEALSLLIDSVGTLPLKNDQSLSKSTSQSSLKKISSVTKPFRQPLMDSERNLPLHSNAYAYKPNTKIQQSEESNKSNTTIKNYYINAENVTIN